MSIVIYSMFTIHSDFIQYANKNVVSSFFRSHLVSNRSILYMQGKGRGFCNSVGKMVLDLYYTPGSPPCQAVQMVAKAVGIDLNLKFVDLVNKEQLKPEYLKVIFK